MPRMKSEFMFNKQVFEKVIDVQIRLKALKLKNVAECGRYLLGP